MIAGVRSEVSWSVWTVELSSERDDEQVSESEVSWSVWTAEWNSKRVNEQVSESRWKWRQC